VGTIPSDHMLGVKNMGDDEYTDDFAPWHAE